MYIMRCSASHFLQAMLVVALLSAAQLAHGQLPGRLLLQMKGFLTYTPDYIKAQGTAVTFDSTETLCFNGGGVPASDPALRITNQILNSLRESGVGLGSCFYIGSSAKPSPANPNNCVDRVPSTTARVNSGNCAYRWRYGYYDLFSYNGEPGTAYWKGLYFTSGSEQVLNQYEQYYWNNTPTAPNRFPRGYYYTINALGTRAMERMDVPAVPVNNDPNPLAKYMAVCEVQLYPERPPTTSRMPQPSFVNGFKDLTWAQEHWWVIFLIVAIILLIVLIAIIIYCCLTSKKPKEEPPIQAMVLRERVGRAYVVADAEQKSSDDNKDYHNGAYLQQQRMAAAQHERDQANEAQRRLGRGFNPQEPRHNPEDMSVGAAGIFGRGPCNLYSDSNVVKDADREKGDNYYANVSGGGLREDELVQMNQPAAVSPEDESASVGPSVTASRRKSSRRSRGRTISQTFDDVDVPEAGEIDEMNVDL